MKSKVIFYLMLSHVCASVFVFPNKSTIITKACNNESVYHLQDNLVLNENGEWQTCHGYYLSEYSNYNCYAYAIENILGPDGLIDRTPGVAPDIGDGASVTERMARSVVSDINSLGFDATYSTTEPSTLENWQSLICLRTFNNDYPDYHFMRLDEDGMWHHKFGDSAPMMYLYHPEEIDWVDMEYSMAGAEGRSGYSYCSQIYYITYGNVPELVEETITVSASGYLTLNSLFFSDLNSIGFLSTDLGLIGRYYGYEYFTECIFSDFSRWETIVGCKMCISLNIDDIGTCRVYDDEMQYLFLAERVDNMLKIDLTYIISNEIARIYLLPTDEDGNLIDFYPNDISYEITRQFLVY